ncbi:MAG: hypothetical protein A2140_03225 [Candidatus Muproteobacteria bacterium RBG_16_62_13]|uniref:protein O-GlcNAc transferase n=1 Tax=Candidatus Muproteobacteria bacterium RBG_16_62_13 TaxID=1817756 RepID=A0A1F6T1T7_9PROT|nr:MAG: hypothetical protein A2140_03225 [Candidatus Muproteobacteria bacterium RBG_16_62_13]
MERGQFAEAKPLYQRIRELDPSDPEAWYALGWIDFHVGAHDSAEHHIRHLTELRPEDVQAHFMLGNILRQDGRIDESVKYFQLAVQYDPSHFQSWANLGDALDTLGKHREATDCYRHGLKHAPNEAALHLGMGKVLQRQSKLDEAADCYRTAIAMAPGFTPAYQNLGVLEAQRGQYDKAIQQYRQAQALDPRDAEVLSNLGNALKGQGRLEEAMECYRMALRINPQHLVSHSNLLLSLNYLPDIDNTTLLREHLGWSKSRSVSSLNTVAESRDPDRRLRIGYLSPDFRTHSVAFFIEAAFREHDHGQYELYAYSDARSPDIMTEKLSGMVDQWRDTHNLSGERFCNQIIHDRIDILIELTGHTSGNRLSAIACKPAPIQATYLGYPCTTGLQAIDYLITDSWVDPPGVEPYYVEKLVRLPHGFSCYNPPSACPPVNDLPATEAGKVTFSSLHGLVKLNDRVIQLWARMLGALPESRLILQAKAFADEQTRKLFLERFEKHGVARQRMELLPFLSLQEHLSVYHRVDMALDPFPWSGHTTSCHALWMGIPVVTLLGQTHAGRMVASALHQIGLSELISQSTDEYIEKTISLANDLPRLAELRRTMRERMLASPLCDGAGFTRELEAAYREMWVRYCEQQRQM